MIYRSPTKDFASRVARVLRFTSAKNALTLNFWLVAGDKAKLMFFSAFVVSPTAPPWNVSEQNAFLGRSAVVFAS